MIKILFCFWVICLFVIQTNAALSQNASYKSDVCQKIERKFSALGQFHASHKSARYWQYEKAIRQQRKEINKTIKIAQRSGCPSSKGLVIMGGVRNCNPVVSALNRMRGNLIHLENDHRKLESETDIRLQKRIRLQRALQVNHCDRGQTQPDESIYATGRKTAKRKSLTELLFRNRTYREDGEKKYPYEKNDLGSSMIARFSNTYRTLCVRSCDGYYFPISFSTIPSRFDDDSNLCQNMCPNRDVSLYYHPIPAEDSEEMISYRTGQPYTDLPMAFSYRKQVNEACSCQFSESVLDNLEEDHKLSTNEDGLQGEYIKKKRTKLKSVQFLPFPILRVSPVGDPETLRNAEGKFQILEIEAIFNRSRAKRYTNAVNDKNNAANDRKIRIIGPEFFPAQ